MDDRRYVITGDMATVEDDGTIRLLGRGSGCINTGGEKVFPEEVEAVLKAHDSVYDAVVVGVADERWGQRVAAVVQPVAGAAPTLEELVEHSPGESGGLQGAAIARARSIRWCARPRARPTTAGPSPSPTPRPRPIPPSNLHRTSAPGHAKSLQVR